ncbi:MAG: hydroxymethylglutaryl-CoA lyase [Ignavibacteria bacterium]
MEKELLFHEVGMRDGLQVEQQKVPTETKIEWIKELISSGLDIVQLGSFVHPEKVPNMADTDELFKYFSLSENKPQKTVLSGLVLNERGLERAINCGVDMICMGVSASETHSKKNTGMTTDEALKRIIAMAKNAISAGKRVQVSVQSAFGCGYEGRIPQERVISIISKYLEEGITNISLADTSGHAYPDQVDEILTKVNSLSKDVTLAVHFHDTYGLGISNCLVAYRNGVRVFESAFAGLGGCPFTAKASGNVCTEDLINMFQRNGIRTDINLEKIISVSKKSENYFKREMPGKVYRMGLLNY